METVALPQDLCALVRRWRDSERSVALVPTMGNLHQGHLDLVQRAQSLAERVVVSIFVNPTQFGEHEDLEGYPRTSEADRSQLARLGVSCVFMPAPESMYPLGLPAGCVVSVPGLSEILCGASRPGHFTGVATVVAKLLNLVQPDVAVFGQKDYQQLVLIRRMTRELFMPVRIEAVPTRREPSGLAMSSRNRYLSGEQRRRATALYGTLNALAEAVAGGRDDFAVLETEGREGLAQAGFKVDYVAIRRAGDLGRARPERDRELVILAAGWLGQARLIDNVRVSRSGAARS